MILARNHRLFLLIALACALLAMTGCGGGTASETPPSNKPSGPESSSLAVVSSEAVASSKTATSTAASSNPLPQSSSNPGTSSQANSSYGWVTRSSGASSEDSAGGTDINDLPPSKPTALKVVLTADTAIVINWGLASDDLGVSAYEILRDGIHIATTSANTLSVSGKSLSFEDRELTPGTRYSYSVRAVDTSGHRSGLSAPIDATTQGGAPGGSQSSAAANSSTANNASSQGSNASRASSVSSGASLSSQASSKASNTSAGSTLTLSWSIPNKREDGSNLEFREIGGYEIRHTPLGSTFAISKVINDANVRSLPIDNASLADTFEIATFDRNGLYSKFLKLTPY